MSHSTRQTDRQVRPVKTKISQDICPVWSESLLCTLRPGRTQSFFMQASKTDQTVHTGQFVGFVMLPLKLSYQAAAHLHLLNKQVAQCAKVKCGLFKTVGSKTTEKRWRHHFPHYKSMGAFCCHGSQSFDPICPKPYAAFPPPQSMMLHIKFDQDWPTGFRDIQVQKCEIFVTQGQVTPKWVVWFGPKSNSPSFYTGPGNQQLWWWFDQKRTS